MEKRPSDKKTSGKKTSVNKPKPDNSVSQKNKKSKTEKTYGRPSKSMQNPSYNNTSRNAVSKHEYNKKNIHKSDEKTYQKPHQKPQPSKNVKQKQTMHKKNPSQHTIPQAEVDHQAEKILHKPNKSNNIKQYSKPLTPAKEPMSQNKRRMKRFLFYAVTLIVLVTICCVLSLTVFFKIDNIEVQGETRYNKDEIISSSCINKGDNLILCSTGNGEEEIEKKFPYIEHADIQKKLFNTIIINITEAKPNSIIESNGKYVVLSESGKIIEVNNEKKYDVPTVLGTNLDDIKLSSKVKYKDDNIKKYVEQIIDAVKNTEIKNIETIDISNLSKIALIRSNGFKIVIGTPENVEYKLKTAKIIMDKNVRDDDKKGVLDVSLASSNGGKSYLKSGNEESSENNSSSQNNSQKPESSKQTSESNQPYSDTQSSNTQSSENNQSSAETQSAENSRVSENTEESSSDETTQ